METKDKSLEVPPQPHFAVQGAREALEKAVNDMRRANRQIDEAGDGNGYQIGLISLALMTRQFLRVLGDVVPLIPTASPPATEAATLRLLEAERQAHDVTRAALVARRQQKISIYEAARRLYHRFCATDDDVMQIWSTVVIDPEPLSEAEMRNAIVVAKRLAALAADQPATEQE